LLDKVASLQDPDNGDKLFAANLELYKYLKSVVVQPQVMKDPLNKAVDKGLAVLTSNDNKLRCYSWDSLTGGTMHYFCSAIVYDAGNGKLKCEVLNPATAGGMEDPGSNFEAVDAIKTKDGKTVYVVRDLFIGGGIDHGRSIQAYVIKNGKLTKYPFFQAGKKLLDSISFGFGEYGDGTEFELSKDLKTLKVPVIKGPADSEPGSGTATGKFLTYSFDGSKFVFKKK
ncbi:MAG: hypothetical protein K2Z81_12635, partial [Cyanobacteria bacterium]|nr:hypothetical protein [Cyanobacteriota bacterium]